MSLWHRLYRPSSHPDRSAALGLRAPRPPGQAGPVGRRGPRGGHPLPARLPPGRAAADALRRGLSRPDRDGVPAGLALRHPPRHLRVDPSAPRQVRHRRRDHALLRRQGHVSTGELGGQRRGRRWSSRACRFRRWRMPATRAIRDRAPTPGSAIASSWRREPKCGSTTSRAAPWSRPIRDPGRVVPVDGGHDRAPLRRDDAGADLAHRHQLARRREAWAGHGRQAGRPSCPSRPAWRSLTSTPVRRRCSWRSDATGNVVSVDLTKNERRHRGARASSPARPISPTWGPGRRSWSSVAAPVSTTSPTTTLTPGRFFGRSRGTGVRTRPGRVGRRRCPRRRRAAPGLEQALNLGPLSSDQVKAVQDLVSQGKLSGHLRLQLESAGPGRLRRAASALLDARHLVLTSTIEHRSAGHLDRHQLRTRDQDVPTLPPATRSS